MTSNKRLDFVVILITKRIQEFSKGMFSIARYKTGRCWIVLQASSAALVEVCGVRVLLVGIFSVVGVV